MSWVFEEESPRSHEWDSKIVHGGSTTPFMYQFKELDWLTLEGWINYIDILSGKTIGDHSKPEDLARSMESKLAKALWRAEWDWVRQQPLDWSKFHWFTESWLSLLKLNSKLRLGLEIFQQQKAKTTSAGLWREHLPIISELREGLRNLWFWPQSQKNCSCGEVWLSSETARWVSAMFQTTVFGRPFSTHFCINIRILEYFQD